MPRVKIDHIVSFSSEDSGNPASNLLQWDISKKKWLCPRGEASCSVVLQLAKSTKISNVQVGAYQTALVEVLVGRSETPNDQYEVLVPSSIFLSPRDSRKEENVERVRSFGSEQFAEGARNQKWDRVRVVCSQPYNKHCKFGLSFIQIYEPESENKPASAVERKATPVPSRLLATDNYSSDEDEFKPGQLFVSYSQSTSSESQKNDTGAQIRQATTQALKNICDPSTKLNRTPIAKTSKRQNEIEDKIADRQRTGLLYREEDDEPCAKIDHAIQTHKDQISKKQDQSTKGKTQKEDKDKQKKLRDSEVRKDRDQNNKPSRESTAKGMVEKNKNGDKDTKKRPHPEIKNKGEILRAGPVSEEPHTLMRGVVFVLSGYENPRRGCLRTAALSMGARCERDWTHACTHLICAFPNTPKLRQVRASPNGAHVPIAKGEWIEECAARRRLLPWQWFATEPARHVPPPADYGEHEKTDSECDTDDEIEKVLNKQKKRKLDKSPQTGGSQDVGTETSREADMQLSRDERVENDASEETGGEDTDVDLDYEQTTKIEEHKGLPNFFEGYTFVIDESVRGCGVDPALLARYVRAYGGLLLQPLNLDEEGDVLVLCGSGGTSNVCGKAVRADWVWECHQRKHFCPIQEYQLT